MSVGSVFIGISKQSVKKKKKTVPPDIENPRASKQIPTAISFFNFRLGPNRFLNTPTQILCSPINLNRFLNTPNLGEEWIGIARMAYRAISTFP